MKVTNMKLSSCNFTLACALACGMLLVPDTTSAQTASLSFVSIQPCRAVDTRVAAGFPSGFGPPSMGVGEVRNFVLRNSANCNSIPASVKAYSVNITVVPPGPLYYLTTWATGAAQPVASTLNAPFGGVVANGTTVPADANGSISVYGTNATDLIIDVTGYYVVASYFPAGSLIQTASYTIQNTDTGTIYSVAPNVTSVTLPTCTPGKRLSFAGTATPGNVTFNVAGSDRIMTPGVGQSTSYATSPLVNLVFVCTPLGFWQYANGL